MQTCHSVAETRAVLQAWRNAGQRIGLVPTMGNLHAGHLHLVEQAQRLADKVVISIFVNPLQFGQGEDLASYPRTLAADQAQLSELGSDLIFAPSPEHIYPLGLDNTCKVEVPELGSILCGNSRPIHFRGVTTVVNMLLNIIQPAVAVFGEKDYQQLHLIRRMVSDLWLPVRIVGVPTVREADGLAMSSRNGYLTPAEREIAPRLYATLHSIQQQLQQGERDFAALEQQAVAQLNADGFRSDYVSIRNADSLQTATATDKQWVILAAAYLGKARLIDNLYFTVRQ